MICSNLLCLFGKHYGATFRGGFFFLGSLSAVQVTLVVRFNAKSITARVAFYTKVLNFVRFFLYTSMEWRRYTTVPINPWGEIPYAARVNEQPTTCPLVKRSVPFYFLSSQIQRANESPPFHHPKKKKSGSVRRHVPHICHSESSSRGVNQRQKCFSFLLSILKTFYCDSVTILCYAVSDISNLFAWSMELWHPFIIVRYTNFLLVVLIEKKEWDHCDTLDSERSSVSFVILNGIIRNWYFSLLDRNMFCSGERGDVDSWEMSYVTASSRWVQKFIDYKLKLKEFLQHSRKYVRTYCNFCIRVFTCV